MVSGKPPRHSKSKAEPVTIDLDAKDVKAISAEGDAARTDDKAGDQTPVAKAEPSVEETKPAAADPAPVWDQPKKSPSSQNRMSARRTHRLAHRRRKALRTSQKSPFHQLPYRQKPMPNRQLPHTARAPLRLPQPLRNRPLAPQPPPAHPAAPPQLQNPHRPPPHLDRPNPPRHNRLNVNRPQPRA